MSRIIDITRLDKVLLDNIKKGEEVYEKLPFDNIEDMEEKWRLDETISSLKDFRWMLKYEEENQTKYKKFK